MAILSTYPDASDPFAEGNHSGLNFAYGAGRVRHGTTITDVAAGTTALTDATTNYVEVDPTDGTVSDNTTGFTDGRIPLFTAVTSGGAITTVTDKRALVTSAVRPLFAKATRQSTSQTYTTGVAADVSWDTEVIDDDGMVDVGGGNPERITVQRAGRAVIIGTLRAGSGTTGTRLVRIRKNGATDLALLRHDAPSTGGTEMTLSVMDDCAASDYYTLYFFHNEGSDLAVGGDVATSLSVEVVPVG